MWKAVVFGALAIGGVGVALVSDFFPTVAQDPPIGLLQPKSPREPKALTGYAGVVKALGADWVELGAGWKGGPGWDSARNEWKKERENDSQKPKRISTAGTLAGGDLNGTSRF